MTLSILLYVTLTACVAFAVALVATALAQILIASRIKMLCAEPAAAESKQVARWSLARVFCHDLIWYLAVLLSGAAIAAAAVNLIGLVLMGNISAGRASAAFAREAIAEQLTAVEVVPGLRLSAMDEFTPSGGNPTVGRPFTVTATLKDWQQPPQRCDAAYLQRLDTMTNVQLQGSGMAISPPSVDAELFARRPPSRVCAIKWEWIVQGSAGGPTSMLVALRYALDAHTSVYRTKPIRFALTYQRSDLVPTLTSLVAALISLAGVLISTWWSKRA